MAEEVKKAPKPVDPNSAKYKLGKIAADAYVDAIEAKGKDLGAQIVAEGLKVDGTVSDAPDAVQEFAAAVLAAL